MGHELSETTTDQDILTGWYDSNGDEDGDKCAFNLMNPIKYWITAIHLLNSIMKS